MSTELVITRLADALLDTGQKMVGKGDDGFAPLGATVAPSGELSAVVVPGVRSHKETRDQLVATLSRLAAGKQIIAAGICTGNFLEAVGHFIAVSVQHVDGTNIAFIHRYRRLPDGSAAFSHEVSHQQGAYQFFSSPGQQ